MSTANGQPLLSALLTMPRVGAWHTEVETETTETLNGSVELELDGVLFRATVVRSGVHAGRGRAKLVGGAGGLSKDLLAKDYVSPKVRHILDDLMTATGETLAAVEASVLDQVLPHWHRSEGRASWALQALVDKLGVVWRVLADGTVWLGEETWPADTEERIVLDEDWGAGIITLAPEAPDLRPGITFDGHKIEQVVHTLTPKALRTELWTTTLGTALDRFLGRIRREIDTSRLYPAGVAGQNAAGTLEVIPDDDRMKGAGLGRVPIRLGVPGTVKVPVGARVRLGFECGDPARPFAIGFDGAELTELSLGSGADFVALADKVLTELNAIVSAFNDHTHTVAGTADPSTHTVTGTTAAPAPPMSTAGSVAADKVKAE